MGGNSAPSDFGVIKLGECPVGRGDRGGSHGHRLNRNHAEGFLPLRRDDHGTGRGQDSEHLRPGDVTGDCHGRVLSRPASDLCRHFSPAHHNKAQWRPRTPGAERVPGPHQESCALGFVKTSDIGNLGLNLDPGGDIGSGGTKLCLTKLRSAGRPTGASRSRCAPEMKMYAVIMVRQAVECSHEPKTTGAVNAGEPR